MAILEEYVEVGLNPSNMAHYEALGYEIPRRLDSWGKMKVARGTSILVKVHDLPRSSNARLTKTCDDCGGHTREQKYQDILRKRDNGIDRCHSCGNREGVLRTVKSGNNIATKYPELSALWHPKLNGALTPSEVAPGSAKRVWWLCTEDGCGHAWEAKVHHITNGRRCPACSMSKGERRVRDYLRFLGCSYAMEEIMGGLIGLSGGSLRYDAAIKKDNGECILLIEFDGEQHTRPVDRDGKGEAYAIEQFRVQREHDRRKTAYARLHRIPLLRIAHTEIDNTERMINEALASVIRGDRVVC